MGLYFILLTHIIHTLDWRGSKYKEIQARPRYSYYKSKAIISHLGTLKVDLEDKVTLELLFDWIISTTNPNLEQVEAEALHKRTLTRAKWICKR